MLSNLSREERHLLAKPDSHPMIRHEMARRLRANPLAKLPSAALIKEEVSRIR